jgi:hypothetical protein
VAADDLVRKMLGDDFAADMARIMAERFSQSWGQQVIEERNRRLGFVTKMVLELQEVKKQTIFSNRWAEAAIESVITGDLGDLKMWKDELSEEGFARNAGPESGPRYAQIYARFQEICEEAYITSFSREKV